MKRKPWKQFGTLVHNSDFTRIMHHGTWTKIKPHTITQNGVRKKCNIRAFDRRIGEYIYDWLDDCTLVCPTEPSSLIIHVQTKQHGIY